MIQACPFTTCLSNLNEPSVIEQHLINVGYKLLSRLGANITRHDMSDRVEAYHTAAWKYADRRKKWNETDKTAWTNAFLVVKTKVNSLPPGAKCNEGTIAPLKQIIVAMAQDLQNAALHVGTASESPSGIWYHYLPREMSNDCRQYMCIILFYILSWAATETASYFGTCIFDTVRSLEDLLLDCRPKEPKSRKRLGWYSSRKRYAEAPSPHSTKYLWKLFVRYRRETSQDVKIVSAERYEAIQSVVDSLATFPEQVESDPSGCDVLDNGKLPGRA